MIVDWICYQLVLITPIQLSRKLLNCRFYCWMIGRAGNWAYR